MTKKPHDVYGVLCNMKNTPHGLLYIVQHLWLYWTLYLLTTRPVLISGGWLLVSNIVMQSSTRPSQLPVKTSYRGISNKQMLLTKSAMKELRKYLPFTQLRFHCKKQRGRTFHIKTANNSKGEAVMQYFSGETNVMPASCGSFVRMFNDNSNLARECNKWGYEKGSYYVGKWGHERDQDRLYDHPAFVKGTHHWLLQPGGRFECDDHGAGVSSRDFWKVFVR